MRHDVEGVEVLEDLRVDMMLWRGNRNCRGLVDGFYLPVVYLQRCRELTTFIEVDGWRRGFEVEGDCNRGRGGTGVGRGEQRRVAR